MHTLLIANVGISAALALLVILGALIALPAIAIAHFGWGHYPALRRQQWSEQAIRDNPAWCEMINSSTRIGGGWEA